jgi:hypothetical protein
MDFDTTVKLHIYRSIADTAKVPTADEIARSLGADRGEVLRAFQNLHQKRLLVPEPDDPARIRMAPPFSGIQTPFAVRVGKQTHFANCVWDALGIAAALHADAVVETADGHSGAPMRIEIRDQGPVAQPCAIHFAVPAAHWWDDIVYT